MTEDDRQLSPGAAMAGPSPARAGLRRRDFLALGSVLAAAPLVEHAAAAATLAQRAARAATAAPPALPLSVGYLEGSGGVTNLHHLAADLNFQTVARREDVLLAARRVVPAASLPGGDSSLAGVPVRISIRGLYPPLPVVFPQPSSPAAAGLPRAVDLDVYVPSVDLTGGAGYLFLAWSFRLLPAIDLSAPLSFLIAPDWYSDFAMVIRVQPARAPAGARPRVRRAAFTLGDALGRPRLQRGAYLLAVNPGIWDHPVELPDPGVQAGNGLLSLLFTVSPEGVGR